jgi:hypothetical protein
MVTLTRARPHSPSSDESTTHRRDDLSDHAHRQLIGYIGLSLPVVLFVIAGARNPGGAGRWRLLDSISAYYYSGAIAAFVGLLVALALFLFTYRGYENRYRRFDRAAGIIGGAAALGVAFFPTAAPTNVPPLIFWTPATGVLHYASAIILFAVFAVFSLWLFRLRAPGEALTDDKRRRNRLYLTCGLLIVATIAWAGINGRAKRSMFLPESIAVVAFAVSWLAKGYALTTIRVKTRSALKWARRG